MGTCSTPFIKSLPNDDPPHSCTQVRRVEEPVGLVVTKGTPLAHGWASEGGPIFAVSLRGAEITRVAEVGEITGAREQRCPVTYQTADDWTCVRYKFPGSGLSVWTSPDAVGTGYEEGAVSRADELRALKVAGRHFPDALPAATAVARTPEAVVL